MNLPDAKQPEVKELLEFYHDRMEGRLTQERLEEACHYWTYDHALDGLRYYPLPSEPFRLKEWRGLSDRQREALPEDVKSSMRGMSGKHVSEIQAITNASCNS